MLKNPCSCPRYLRRFILARNSPPSSPGIGHLQTQLPTRPDQWQSAKYGTAALARTTPMATSPRVASTSYSRHQPVKPLRNGPGKPDGGDEERVSDKEWDLRTGRAIDLLQKTLPNFFSTGLVAIGPHSFTSALHLPNLHSLGGLLDPKGKGKAQAEDEGEFAYNSSVHDIGGLEEEIIYSKHIRLEYTPPVELPAPFPRTLFIEGLPLYVASSAFIRHTFHALYTDLSVGLLRVTVRDGPTRPTELPSPTSTSKSVGESRERSVTISLLASGQGRLGLSSDRAEWDVTSTYLFCPRTGRVNRHTVNAIHPAPHDAVYSALRSSLDRLGLGGTGLGLGGDADGNLGKGAVGMSSHSQTKKCERAQ